MNFDILKKTPLYKALSERGKRIFLPEGIFYWSGRAKKEAEYIGTLGSAYAFERDFCDSNSSRWVPCYLEYLNEYFNNLDVSDLVPYASISGLGELRKIWKDWIIEKSRYNHNEKEERNRLQKYITSPIVTSGVTNGIFMASSMFLNPNELIICPNKRWGNYDNILNKLLGVNICSFEFFKADKLNIEGLRKAIYEVSDKQDKIIILLGFPNNPTGYIPTRDESSKLIEMLKDVQKKINKTFLIFIDDAYEPYIYSKDALNPSLFYDLHQLDEEIIPIKLDGVTKELLMYGARIGFITIGFKPYWIDDEKELEELKIQIENKLSGFIRSSISNCNHFYQAVTIKFFKEKGMENILKKRSKISNLLKLRYDLINLELQKIDNKNISVDPNGGGFFLFLNLNPNKIKATEFADHLLKKYKVGVIPFENFNEKINGIRIAYCSIDINQIPEFIKRINLALEDFN